METTLVRPQTSHVIERPEPSLAPHVDQLAPVIPMRPTIEHTSLPAAPEKVRKPITDPRIAKFVLHAAVLKNERKHGVR